jgi:hypothetical protein
MVQAALASFGAGRLFGTRTDIAGIQTPLEFGVLQDVALDFSYTMKPLMGSNQFAVFTARGEGKITAKAKMGIMSGDLIGQLFFGLVPTAGQSTLKTAFAAVVPTTPFQITIVPPLSGTFAVDEGVTYAATGLPLTEVASAPAVGQYSVNTGTGIYLFAVADVAAAILINYTYNVSAVGQKIIINNQQLGYTPYFSAVFANRDPRSGLFNTLTLNRCSSDKLALASKTSDYSIPEFDFFAMDDGTGQIGTWSFGDAS